MANVQAIEPTTIGRISLHDFNRFLDKNQSLSLKYREYFRAVRRARDEQLVAENYSDNHKYLALIAHTNMKVSLMEFCTIHTYKLENAGATCFAEFTDSKKLKYEHTVNDLSAGKDKFDSSFATGWSLFNADKKMVKQLRVQIRSLFENDSNIIKALGGSTPLNYYGWDESISARVKWVNGSIDRWAQAMKQTAQ